MDRDEFDLLTKAELCKLFGVSDSTLDRWIEDRLVPRPVKYGRQVRWRWGLLKRWMEATEFLQGADVRVSEDDEADGGPAAKHPTRGSPEGHLPPSGPTDGSEGSEAKKRR